MQAGGKGVVGSMRLETALEAPIVELGGAWAHRGEQHDGRRDEPDHPSVSRSSHPASFSFARVQDIQAENIQIDVNAA